MNTTKYIFDRLTAFFGLLLFMPVMLVTAWLILIKMPDGKVLFRQKRVGKGGKLFEMVKFRTMSVHHDGSSVSATTQTDGSAAT